jgi:hypothetical protein
LACICHGTSNLASGAGNEAFIQQIQMIPGIGTKARERRQANPSYNME